MNEAKSLRSGSSDKGRAGTGVAVASIVIAAWAAHLWYSLAVFEVSFAGDAAQTTLVMIGTILHMAVQGYLYTGLFITAHDAMHQSVSHNRRANRAFGALAAFLFAAFSYKRLLNNHFKHHRWPGEARDPDFCTKSQNFWVWFFTFFFKYVTVVQFVVMAVIFNVLIRLVPVENVVLFWIVPAFLGTLQLFYFGTYRPHRLPHTDEMLPHRARTQRKNDVWAMVSCYFFGYHYEHHASPGTPWWKLHRSKS